MKNKTGRLSVQVNLFKGSYSCINWPHYDKRLLIDLPFQYMKATSSEHVAYINCFERQNKNQFMYATFSQLIDFMYWTGKLMNNLLSYCWFVDAIISASEKELPVTPMEFNSMELWWKGLKFVCHEIIIATSKRIWSHFVQHALRCYQFSMLNCPG